MADFIIESFIKAFQEFERFKKIGVFDLVTQIWPWFWQMTFNDLTAVLYWIIQCNKPWNNLRILMLRIKFSNLGVFRILYDQLPQFDANFRSLTISQHGANLLLMRLNHTFMILIKIPTDIKFPIIVIFFLVNLLIWQQKNLRLEWLQLLLFWIFPEINIRLTLRKTCFRQILIILCHIGVPSVVVNHWDLF